MLPRDTGTPRASKPEISCGLNTYGLTEVRSEANTARQHVEAVTTAGNLRCPHMYRKQERLDFHGIDDLHQFVEFPMKTSGVDKGT